MCDFFFQSHGNSSLSRSECRENVHGVEDVDERQDQGDERAALKQALEVIAAIRHTHGNGRSCHRGEEGGHRTRTHQQNKAGGVCTQSGAGQQADGNKDSRDGAVQHELGQQEGHNEEECAEDVVIVGASDNIGQCAADEIACAGVGQSRAQSQRTDEEHQHIPRDVAQGRLGIDYTEQNHQQAADQRDRPSGEVELRGEDEAEDGHKEDDDTNFIDQRAELFGLLAGLFLFQSFDGNDRLLRGEFRAKEQCPERNDNEDRPGADGKVDGADAHTSEAVGLEEARVLACHLDGRCQREDAAAGHADDHDREHILRTAVSGLIAERSQQRADDGVNDHRAGDEVCQQNGDEDVAEVSSLEAAAGQFHDAVAQTIDHRSAAETGCHNEHGRHQQSVHIREASQRTVCVDAAGKVQRSKRDHCGKPHGDLVQHIADQRCRKDHHTDDHLSVHKCFPFPLLFHVFLNTEVRCCPGRGSLWLYLNRKFLFCRCKYLWIFFEFRLGRHHL